MINQLFLNSAEITQALGDRHRGHWLRGLCSQPPHRWRIDQEEVNSTVWAALSAVRPTVSDDDPLKGLIELANDYG